MGAEVYAVDTLALFRTKERKPGNARGFALKQIFERYVGQHTIDSHTAEGDTVQLMKSCIAIKNDFVSIAESKKFAFDNIMPK